MATVLDSTISGFTIKNSPFHTFSIVDCKRTTLSGLTLDSSDGHGIDKNTDGFDLASNEYVTIKNNNIFNHDDCIAVTSGIHTIFSGNECTESHGISIGSVGGNLVDDSTTVSDFVAQDNTITNSLNGLRIKAVADLKGMVDNVKFINNHLENVKNAIAIHSNYNRATGGYSGNPTSMVTISKIKVDGLSGSASQVYDIFVNPNMVSMWTFTGITVTGAKGTCTGQPTGIC
ncbi:unnamed protein product [Peronospora belbahrii]|nr:unnamed protein product [Peronospora belbahrii]